MSFRFVGFTLECKSSHQSDAELYEIYIVQFSTLVCFDYAKNIEEKTFLVQFVCLESSWFPGGCK